MAFNIGVNVKFKAEINGYLPMTNSRTVDQQNLQEKITGKNTAANVTELQKLTAKYSFDPLLLLQLVIPSSTFLKNVLDFNNSSSTTRSVASTIAVG
jgi:hypothetical protein